MKRPMNTSLLSAFVIALMITGCESQTTSEKVQEAKTEYLPDWNSLLQHNSTPEWFQDAKLGIYFHWGVYTVPAYFSEWYPYQMYMEGSDVYKHHQQTYGDQSEFGYHEFVKDFTGEYFDADEWVTLFKKAGARFAGPVAQHHDGFAMWDSEVNPWNSVDKGPNKDITGELATALRKNDMKLIATFHHARNLQRYRDTEKKGFASHFVYNEKWHTSTTDPELKLLYGNVEEDWFNQYWYDQIDEVVKQYDPDIIWFDSWLNFMPEDLTKKMVANFFNNEVENGQQVVICNKQTDLPQGIGVHDIEQGGRRDISAKTWMTDITISRKSWSYIEGQTYKPASLVLRNFIDVVSKNGVVLLNVSPKADGSIPDEQRKVLLDMGAWFDNNGEAIFNTRPWVMFGFGDAIAGAGHLGGQSSTVEYSATDVRFTQSKDGKTLYMIFLGVPEQGWTEHYRIMAEHRYFPDGKVKNISLLATGKPLEYKLDGYGFSLNMPSASALDNIANVVKIEVE